MRPRSTTVLASALWLLALPLAAAETPAASSEWDAINQALDGRKVTIDLANGSQVQGARHVSVSSSTTTWKADGEVREIETESVDRLTIEKRNRVLRGLGWGAAIGAGLNLLGVSYSEIDGLHVEVASDTDRLVQGTLLGAAAGAAVGAAKGNLPPEVVYEN